MMCNVPKRKPPVKRFLRILLFWWDNQVFGCPLIDAFVHPREQRHHVFGHIIHQIFNHRYGPYTDPDEDVIYILSRCQRLNEVLVNHIVFLFAISNPLSDESLVSEERPCSTNGEVTNDCASNQPEGEFLTKFGVQQVSRCADEHKGHERCHVKQKETQNEQQTDAIPSEEEKRDSFNHDLCKGMGGGDGEARTRDLRIMNPTL